MTQPDQTKVSRDLAEILDLAPWLLSQAVSHARAQVDGHSLPGGLAMVSMAPVGRQSKWTDRILDAEHAWYEANPGAPADQRPEWGVDDDDDWEPALQTLRFWSDHYRKALGMQYDQIPTIATEAAFLRHESVLTWIFGREPHLAQFADDVNLARRRLENVVHAGNRTERTRIVCNNCDAAPQLIKVYEPRRAASYACAACSTPVGVAELDHCPNPFCWSVVAIPTAWTSDPRNDTWKCPSCKTRYDADALRRAHGRQLVHASAARYIPWDQARATLSVQGRSDRTVRKWMAPHVEEVDVCARCRHHWPRQEWPVCPRRLKLQGVETGEVCGGMLTPGWRGDREAVVEAYCEVGTHRVMVWWPDLWTLHRKTKIRKPISA